MIFGTFRQRIPIPARDVVTARLLGDPAPDRVVPDIPPDPDRRLNPTPPPPVYLTFEQMRAAYNEETD